MKITILASLLLFLLSCSAAAVPVTAVTVSGGAPSSNTFTWGYNFSINQDATITSLGVFDDLGNGMPQAQNVAIWDSLGAIVLQGVVAAGTSDPLIDGFRFTSTLTGSTSFSAGTYTIGTQRIGVGDVVAFLSGSVSVVSGVNLLGTFHNGNDTVFSQPTTPFGNTMIGPSFQIEFASASVPELSPGGISSVLAILACLLATVDTKARRNRNRCIS